MVIKINGIVVNLVGPTVIDENRKPVANYGSIKVLNTTETRYEPYSVVDITEGSNTYQLLVESDEPLQLKSDLWEHKITLIENMAKFDTIFPVNRSFTTVPAKSIGEILVIYKRELAFYQQFNFDFDDTDVIYDTKMPYKEYNDQSMSAIIYDLFHRIDAIPRATYDSTTDIWNLTYELYTEKNNEISYGTESQQSTVNDVDYASEILSRSRNAVNETTNNIWFPNKNGAVTPRIKGEFFKTSDLEYQFPDGILGIEQAICPNVTVYISYYDNVLGVDVDELYSVDVDFTRAVVTEEEWNTLQNNAFNGVVRGILHDYVPGGAGDSGKILLYRQNTIYYSIGGNTINNLYNNVNGLLGFSVDIYPLYNAIYQFVRESTLNAHPLPEYIGVNDYNFSFDLPTSTNTEDIECRFLYKPKRDIDVIIERNNMASINKSTIMNSQKDNYIDLPRFIEENNAKVNRIATETKTQTTSFNTSDNYWKLGDYVGDWLIIDIRYIFNGKGNVVCLAEFAKDFSNIEREYSITREPSAFSYTGKRLTSNFIYREYLEFYTGTNDKPESDFFTTAGKAVAINLLDYNSANNKPFYNALLRPKPLPSAIAADEIIHAPVFGNGASNLISMHFGFGDPRVAGYGMTKITEITQGTYGWYKNPVKYVQDDFTLEQVIFTLNNGTTFITDTTSEKYYPLVEYNSNSDDYVNFQEYPTDKNIDDALAFTVELIPFSDNENIIIGSAFSKYNNLIYEFSTTPTLDLYSSDSKYTIFDKKIRSGDVLNLTGYTITGDTITTPTLEFWALAYGDEIVLAGNNFTNEFKFKFIKNRYVTGFVTALNVELEFEAQMIFDISYTKQEFYQLDFVTEFSTEFLVDYTKTEYQVINANITLNIETEFNVSYEVTEYEYKSQIILLDIETEFNISYDKDFRIWTASNLTEYTAAASKDTITSTTLPVFNTTYMTYNSTEKYYAYLHDVGFVVKIVYNSTDYYFKVRLP